MGVNPIPILAISLLGMVFVGLVFGAELAERSFPEFEQPEKGGFWGALEAILAILQAVWGVVVFFFNLVTFNVPGAPWYARVLVGGILGGGLVWAIAEMVRGK